MTERDFEVNGRKFKLGKINAFKQFHIVRRLAPVLSDLLPVMGDIQKVTKPGGELSESEKFDQLAKIASPILVGLSNLSDKDADLVLYGLLSSVEMQQSTGNWAKVATESMLMMGDLELPILLQIAGRAFVYNLSGFFAVLPQLS